MVDIAIDAVCVGHVAGGWRCCVGGWGNAAICECRVPTCQETVRVRTGEREALPNTRPLMLRFRATRFARAQALAAAREEGLLEAAGMLAAGVPFEELVLRGFPDAPPITADDVDDDLLARHTTKTRLRYSQSFAN